MLSAAGESLFILRPQQKNQKERRGKWESKAGLKDPRLNFPLSPSLDTSSTYGKKDEYTLVMFVSDVSLAKFFSRLLA